MGLISLIWSVISTVLGWCGIGQKDERDTERAAGETLGQKETEASNATRALDEVQDAVAARDADHAANAADPDRLRDPSAAGARPFRSGPD